MEEINGGNLSIHLVDLECLQFRNLLLAHIQPILLTTCMPQWVYSCQSTITVILALRLLSELHRRAVCSKGIPNILLCLIEDLHQNTGACVCIGGKLLLRFKLSFWCKAGLRSCPSLVLCYGGLSRDDFDECNKQRHLIWFGCWPCLTILWNPCFFKFLFNFQD